MPGRRAVPPEAHRPARAPSSPADEALADPQPPFVLEESSELAWRRFEALLNDDGAAGFDSTQSSLFMPGPGAQWDATAPATVTQPLAPRVPEPLALSEDLDGVLDLARSHNRVAPVASAWRALYDMLPHAEAGSHRYSPPPPLSMDHSNAIQRRLRLRDQIEWAHLAGCLGPVQQYLRQLRPDQWTYL